MMSSTPFYANAESQNPPKSKIGSSSYPEIKTIPQTSEAHEATKPATSRPAKKNKDTDDGHGKQGPFAPLVMLTKEFLGDDELNRLRGKAIALHSDVIGKFVETAESRFGQRALQVLFTLADKDHNGTIDEEELKTALMTLGFDHLKEKQIVGIFQRADADANGALDFEEWRREAPKTLRTNLVKLAKKNGGELGFLA
jgi:EF-hand domain pair